MKLNSESIVHLCNARITYIFTARSISLLETEGTWIDFDGKLLGSGVGTRFIVEADRYHNWNRGPEFAEPNDYKFSEDFALTYSDGSWNDADGYSVSTLLCLKPAKGTELKVYHVQYLGYWL